MTSHDPVTHLGIGVGVRGEFAAHIMEARGQIDFLEVMTEACFEPQFAAKARTLRREFPVVCHGLDMSLGAADPLNQEYVEKVEGVLAELKPVWFSDHLAVTRVGEVDIGYLSPAALDEETISVVVDKIKILQARSGLPMLLENIAYYFALPETELTEHEVLTRIVEKADCGLLLDLNNLLANARNHRMDPYAFLDGIPLERVVQVHIAGGAWRDEIYVDTHGHPVEEEVWQFLEYVCRRAPVKGVLLERDLNIPPFREILAELDRARSIMHACSGWKMPERSVAGAS